MDKKLKRDEKKVYCAPKMRIRELKRKSTLLCCSDTYAEDNVDDEVQID